MATLREKIVDILNTDAKLSGTGTLGYYLNKRSTAPYGVFFIAPPEIPDIPFITYQFLTEDYDWTDEIFFQISVYSDDFDHVVDRLRTLLHNTNLPVTDKRVLRCRWDWSGPDLWDDDLNTYVKHVRFYVKAK